jgi:hypothetical protein
MSLAGLLNAASAFVSQPGGNVLDDSMGCTGLQAFAMDTLDVVAYMTPVIHPSSESFSASHAALSKQTVTDQCVEGTTSCRHHSPQGYQLMCLCDAEK